MEKAVDALFARDTRALGELLRSGGFKVNDFISYGRTALSLAASCGYIDVMQFLAENGADINLNNGDDLGYTPIEEAARDNKLEAIEWLLDHGAEIDKGNTIGSNALIGACIGAYDKAVKCLLKRGANVDHADNKGQTALHYICRNAKQWGACTITTTVNGVTTEVESTRFQEHTVIFNILLEHNANVNHETNYGFTPLHQAAESNADTFILPLIEKGARINMQNARGFSPLQAAADKGHFNACKMLVGNGADVNVIDNDGFTPLLGAVMSGNEKLVGFLLEKGARKDVKALVGYSVVAAGDDPMAVAQKLGNTVMMELLK